MYRYEWAGGGYASFKTQGTEVLVDHVIRGGAPKGSAGAMLADSMQAAGVSQPTALYGPNIIQKSAGSTDLIENLLRSTAEELGGTVGNVTRGVEAGKVSVRVEITYPK